MAATGLSSGAGILFACCEGARTPPDASPKDYYQGWRTIMSSESAAPLAPAAPEAPAAPAAPAGAGLLPASAAPEAARALSVQERRLQVARDINAKIDSLEADIARLSGAFGESRAQLAASLEALQLRTHAGMADLLRASTRLEAQVAHQDGELRVLDERLSRGVSELGHELGTVTAVLRQQEDRLGELQERHDQLTRLHEHLDRLTAGQARQLDVLSTDTHRHLRLLRTHIDGLGALYREQRQALGMLRDDHDLLAREAAATAAMLAGLATKVTQHEGRTHGRFRLVAAGLATLAVVSLGLIAWFQLHPTAVPETVRTGLAGLSAGLDRQSGQNRALAAAVLEGQETVARQMGTQERTLQRQGRELARLKTETRNTGARLRRLEARLAAPAATPTPVAPSAP